ncbi:threonine aspartase 1 [Musca domestica]|uniref:Threonine aspartase 1 n=1 Tax=Musca domestica TaxID=7370 RepID=A0A1I8MC62_MUSDO|nr:threonine aspartase 1 [Musca domestica]
MSGFVAVHTGAGNILDETKYQRVIKEACIAATDILKNGGSAMDACEAAIIRLENCGNTNAGFGSNLCWDGYVQCDASIMNGSNLHFGACTNVSTVKNPIQLARMLCEGQERMLSMERIPPMIMAGTGAENFAEEMGCAMIDASAMISSKAKFTYTHYKSKVGDGAKVTSTKIESNPEQSETVDAAEVSPLDTVGAVCVDSTGNSAAGCSSGGLILKVPGRVGQAATYGAGCWATDTDDLSVATCTTGNGEYLMKTFLAKEICTDLFTSDCAVTSLHKTFKSKFLESPFLPADQCLYGGALSLIYYPKNNCGEVLWSHTTKSFCVGYMSTQQKTPKFVYSPLPAYSQPGKSSVVNGHNFHLRV